MHVNQYIYSHTIFSTPEYAFTETERDVYALPKIIYKMPHKHIVAPNRAVAISQNLADQTKVRATQQFSRTIFMRIHTCAVKELTWDEKVAARV